MTIRNLEDDVKRRLRVRAAEHGRSMEEEARAVLRESVGFHEPEEEYGVGSRIHAMFREIGGVDLEIPPRDAERDPPTFE